MIDSFLEIKSPSKTIKLNNETKIILNFKMSIIIIGIIISIIISGWGFINSKINKINTNLQQQEQTDLTLSGKVDIIDVKLDLILNIYGIQSDFITEKESTNVFIDNLAYQYHPSIPLKR